MKAVVFAYHEIGAVCLEELLEFDVEVKALFTHQDDPGEEIWFRRPAEIARGRGIPVHTEEDLGDARWAEYIGSLGPDVIFSFYYRKLIPKAILDIAPVGAFNLHGSLLPRFRGRCPVNWVLIEGETRTGLTLHVMEEKADTGDIVIQREIAITLEDTAYSLFMKMVGEARTLMREVLPGLRDGTFVRLPQQGPSSYYGGRRPEDGLIAWDRDARAICNLIRATTHPYPGAFTYFEGKKLYIWGAVPEAGDEGSPLFPGSIISLDPLRVSTGEGSLRLTRVQLEGGPEMDGRAFVLIHDLRSTILGGKP